jgi:hypothetical protein
MPDAKEMSGIPRPVDDLPAGTVSVRVIRGQLSNNLSGRVVTLQGGGKTLTSTTDENGRAEFKGVAAGTSVKASADVDGEHLESQDFPFPTTGIRMLLVATDKEAAAKPAVTGQVTLGGQSRIVIEPGDESVEIYYLLSIQNGSSAPVNTAAPFAFEMPTGAIGTTLLQGSTPQASVTGTHVLVRGPFAPGATFVQVACQVPSTSGTLEITARFPVQLEQLAVVVKKVGDVKLSSPAVAKQQDIAAEGDTFIAASGGAVAADQAVQLLLSGLPHHSGAPRIIALAFAVGIVVFGAWTATRTTAAEPTGAGERKRLIARREKLLADLVRVEGELRSGRGGAKQTARREEIMSALEQVYGALDEAAAPLAGDQSDPRRDGSGRVASEGGATANA